MNLLNLKSLLRTIFPFILLFSLSFFCSRLAPVNDFFGVKMPVNEADKFKIISYSEEDGATYQGSLKMDTDIYGYAEVRGKMLQLKIINESEETITSNFITDQTIVFTKDNKKYLLNKGEPTSYPNQSIKPNSSKEIMLQFPNDFWKTVGMTDANSYDADYRDEFWTGLNQIDLVKNNIEKIKVLLGGKITIILKPIVEIRNEEN